MTPTQKLAAAEKRIAELELRNTVDLETIKNIRATNRDLKIQVHEQEEELLKRSKLIEELKASSQEAALENSMLSEEVEKARELCGRAQDRSEDAIERRGAAIAEKESYQAQCITADQKLKTAENDLIDMQRLCDRLLGWIDANWRESDGKVHPLQSWNNSNPPKAVHIGGKNAEKAMADLRDRLNQQ